MSPAVGDMGCWGLAALIPRSIRSNHNIDCHPERSREPGAPCLLQLETWDVGDSPHPSSKHPLQPQHRLSSRAQPRDPQLFSFLPRQGRGEAYPLLLGTWNTTNSIQLSGVPHCRSAKRQSESIATARHIRRGGATTRFRQCFPTKATPSLVSQSKYLVLLRTHGG